MSIYTPEFVTKVSDVMRLIPMLRSFDPSVTRYHYRVCEEFANTFGRDIPDFNRAQFLEDCDVHKNYRELDNSIQLGLLVGNTIAKGVINEKAK